MAVVLDDFNFGALQVAQDLLNTHEECSLRGLKNTAKWLAELNYAVSQKLELEIADNLFCERQPIKERSKYILAKSYFDVKEYSR